MEDAFALMGAKVAHGGRALDVGCGPGSHSNKAVELGASYVLGVDISQHYVDEATERYGGNERLEFRVQSVHEPIEGTFDLVFGFAVLHHLNFRQFLSEAYQRNVLPGGRMLFWEPMSHPLTVAFHTLVRSAHSEDEWPITASDVRWLHQTFEHVTVRPVNLMSVFTNALSSLTFPSPNNPLSRFGDRIDRSLERRKRFAPYGQMGIVVIDKPG